MGQEEKGFRQLTVWQKAYQLALECYTASRLYPLLMEGEKKLSALTGEVVLVRNRLLNIVNYLETKYTDDPHVENLFETVSFLDLVTSDMQIAVMKMRMQPIKKVFSKFPRVVRDIAASLDKEVDLKISGEDTEVDKSVMEQIGDPLVHIIRNAIDYGIESTEVRRRMGKPEKGTISISASQKGNHIVIEVSDNGKGIDVERVKKKAVEKALMSEEEAQRMTQDAAVNLVFLPGFTTADVASELSGRGVGMDVVKTNISKLNGYVEIDTRRDTGTTFRISIPLTLAIVQAFMVKAGGGQYAIPLAPIEGTLKVEKKEISDVVRKKVLIIRGRVHPFLELSGILGGNGSGEREHRYAIIVNLKSLIRQRGNGSKAHKVIVVASGKMTFGILVDGITGVINIAESEIEHAEQFLNDSMAQIKGVAKLNDRLVVLLDTKKTPAL